MDAVIGGQASWNSAYVDFMLTSRIEFLSGLTACLAFHRFGLRSVRATNQSYFSVQTCCLT